MLKSKVRSMGPYYGPLDLFEGVLGTLKSLYRVYSRYLGIPGLRAQVYRVQGLGFDHYP